MTVLHVVAGRGLDGMLLMFYGGSTQTVDRMHQVVNLKDKVFCMCCVKYVSHSMNYCSEPAVIFESIIIVW